MLYYTVLGTLILAATVLLHASGTSIWLHYVAERYADEDKLHFKVKSFPMLTSTAVVLVLLHSAQITIWALAYLFLLPTTVLGTFEEATYFSFVTFTTLGYGDITLSGEWRIMSGIQALNGILLIGWSTAMLFAIVQRIWQDIANDTDPPS
jgi:hypothetical protein